MWRSRVSSAFPFSAKLDGEFIPFEIDPPEFLARAYFYSSPSSSGSRTPPVGLPTNRNAEQAACQVGSNARRGADSAREGK